MNDICCEINHQNELIYISQIKVKNIKMLFNSRYLINSISLITKYLFNTLLLVNFDP